MEKLIPEVPVASAAIRKMGVPLSPVVTAGGFVYVSGQVPMADHAAEPSRGLQIDMLGEEFGDLGLDRLGQQGARSVAQHLGERVGKRPWLKQLDDVSIGHGVSLLCWRSGGANTPTIRRLLPLSPSPTFAHCSISAAGF